MSPTEQQPQTSSATVEQMSLPGADELFRAVGLDTLPHGVTQMTRKQLDFTLAYLRCGNARQAAREIGANETNASKLLKAPAVLRLVNDAARVVAQNGDQLVRRAWERSVSLHEELMALRGRPHDKRTKAEHQRESQLMHHLTRNDMLLAALLNRLGIKLTGEVTHTVQQASGDFIVVPPDVLPGLAAMRQDAVRNRVTSVAGGQN